MNNQTFNGQSQDAQPQDAQPQDAEPSLNTEGSLDEQIPSFLRRLTHDLFSGADAPGQTPLLGTVPRDIPSELRDIAQWLMWRGKWKPGQNGSLGKWNKVPFQPDGSYARSNDSTTWTTFPVALRAYLDSRDPELGIAPFSGLGFVLTRENGIVGIDMDDVIDLATGTIKSQAITIIKLLHSYCEVSPSGTGLRIFVRGKLPPTGRVRSQSDGSKYETYDGGRYLTVTGRKLPGVPATIEQRNAQLLEFHARYITAPMGATPKDAATYQSEMGGATRPIVPNALTDDELLHKARNSRKGTEFTSLWDGALKHPALVRCKEDHSSADLALCNRLAFWTGRDAERMDRLFRQSGLMRDKWDVRHSSDGRTYGQMTVERAIKNCGHCFGERKPGTFGEVAFPPLTAEEIPSASGSAGKDVIYAEGQILKLLYPDWSVGTVTSEAAHASRLAQGFDGDLRYCPQLGWLLFNGKFWERDDKDSHRTAAAVARLSEVVRAEITRLYELGAILARAGRQGDAAAMTLAAKTHSRHVKTVETNRFIRDTLAIAAGNLIIAVETFNVRPFRLAFQNCVWDKGVRRPHQREDYLLSLSPIEITLDGNEVSGDETDKGDVDSAYRGSSSETLASPKPDPGGCEESLADSKPPGDWDVVLNRITNGDTDLERMLQDVVGYTLSGSSDLRTILWFYGAGGTGKSTISELVQTVLGAGTYPVPPDKLGSSSDRERLAAALWNCFLAVCSESSNKKLDAEVLKLLSGSDTLSARFLYHEPFNMNPTHVMMLISISWVRFPAACCGLRT